MSGIFYGDARADDTSRRVEVALMLREPEIAICPVYRYADAPRAIEWLGRAFGYTLHEIHKDDAGLVVHAELRHGAGALALSAVGPSDPSNPWTSVRQGIYVCATDIDAIFARAHSHHADIVQPPRDTSYGAREGSLFDVGRHLWSFGSYPMGVGGAEPTLFVGLHYADGPGALRFLEHALGFTPGLRVDGAHGIIDHAELSLGRHSVMISSSPTSSGHWHGHVQSTHVWVDDVDDHHARAAGAGATIIEAPHDTPYGARTYYALDCEGFVWTFGTYRPTRG